jgi:hypothetical protein
MENFITISTLSVDVKSLAYLHLILGFWVQNTSLRPVYPNWCSFPACSRIYQFITVVSLHSNGRFMKWYKGTAWYSYHSYKLYVYICCVTIILLFEWLQEQPVGIAPGADWVNVVPSPISFLHSVRTEVGYTQPFIQWVIKLISQG